MTTQSPLHPRSAHNGRYDLFTLGKVHKPLVGFIKRNPRGEKTINFANPSAVVALNTALLKYHYGVEHWSIPKGFLCPPIPGRADYIHYLADLIGEQQPNAALKILDVGTGSNLIYPLIGAAAYHWQFVGSDINESALKNAQEIVDKNGLSERIALRHQPDQKHILEGIIKDGDYFNAVMCNPPFHQSAAEAAQGSERKVRQLSKHKRKKMPKGLNFGGVNNELWCEGGEVWFVKQMIKESQQFSKQVGWFTSLVAKSDDLAPIKRALKKLDLAEVKIVNMAQGSKESRFVAWRF